LETEARSRGMVSNPHTELTVDTLETMRKGYNALQLPKVRRPQLP